MVADTLRAVLAFPSTYTVGITSLGYQVVWATLVHCFTPMDSAVAVVTERHQV